MRHIILTALALLFVSTATQASAPIRHRHASAKYPSLIYQPWRDSNASAVQGTASSYSEAAMTSGIAGH